MTERSPGKIASRRLWKSLASFMLTFFLMFCLWIVLSGKFEPLLLSLGVASSCIVALFSHNLLFSELDFSAYIPTAFRLIFIYIPWLIYQILKANMHLLYLVFHPRMLELIDPHIVTFQSKLRKEMSIVTMANSITLTPGTITVSSTLDGVFKVHSIDRESSQELPEPMQSKVGDVFGE